MQTLLLFYITFLFSSLITSALIPESDFIPLDSYSEHYFKLFKHYNVSEGYFTFTNQNKEGDLLIHLAKGQGFSITMYIYTDINEIKQNENMEYIDYKYKDTINKNILSYPSLNSDKVYIIVKENLGLYYDDYIMIYNELDEIYLENNKPSVIYKFFSHNCIYK